MQKIKFMLPLAVLGGLITAAAACGDDSSPAVETDSGTQGDGSNKDGGSPDSAALTFAVGGTVTGLAGTGLVLDNNGDTVAVAATDKAFVFPKKLAKGATYKVSAKSQPGAPTQTCVVTAGDGTVAGDVTSIKVDCTTNSYGIDVSVVGLEGTGLVLENNAADDLAVAPASPVGPVKATFSKKIDSGKTYEITIKSQPKTPGQVCKVSGGKGTVVAGIVAGVTVTCDTSYTIGGTLTGLAGKDLILQNNAGDDLKLNANGTFAFATSGIKGDKYAITVKQSPTAPWQTCSVTPGTEAGTLASANVTAIAVTCTTNKYAISGTITGLTGKGAILQNNGGDPIALAAGDTKFAFATKIDSGAMYTVTVATVPNTPTQTCVVTNGGPFIVAGADVTNVAIACTTNKYTVNATVTGTTGAIVLQNNAGDDLSFAADSTKAFATKIVSNAPYNVTIKSSPVGLSCVVVSGAGTVTNADVTVSVACGQKSCKDIKAVNPNAASGLYLIDPDGPGGIAAAQLYCDMTTAGGGWTVASYIRKGTQYDVAVGANNGNVGDTANGFASGATLTTMNPTFQEKIVVYLALYEGANALGAQWMKFTNAGPLTYSAFVNSSAIGTYVDSLAYSFPDTGGQCSHGCGSWRGFGMFLQNNGSHGWGGTQGGDYGCRDGNNICWMPRSLGCNVGAGRCANLVNANEGVWYGFR